MSWTKYALFPPFCVPRVVLNIQQQKWSSCSWLLLREFVKMRQEQEHVRDEAIRSGQLDKSAVDLPLPVIPYVRTGLTVYVTVLTSSPFLFCQQWRCRQIMTRADFLEGLCSSLPFPL